MAQDPRDLNQLLLKIKHASERDDYQKALASAQTLYELLVVLNYKKSQFGFEQQDSQSDQNNAISEPGIETIKDIVAQIEPQSDQVDLLLENQPKFEKQQIEEDFEPITRDFHHIPEFDPIAPKPDLEDGVSTEQSDHQKSLNETLRVGGIALDLNDRLAFMQHLFDGKSADFGRVFEMLDNIETFQEAVHFIQKKVKPDYNQWEGKSEYEERLMLLIANKFGK